MLFPQPQVEGGSWLPAALPRTEPVGRGDTLTSFSSLCPIPPGKREQGRSKAQTPLSLLPFHRDILVGQTQFLLQEFPQGCLAVTLAAFVPTALCGVALIRLSTTWVGSRVLSPVGLLRGGPGDVLALHDPNCGYSGQDASSKAHGP